MARRKRRLLLRLFLFALAVAVAAVIAAPFVPLDSFKPTVETRLSATLGREVTVGSLSLSLLGGPFLIIDDLVAKEDAAFGGGDFIKAEQVRADLVVMPLLLRREAVIESLFLRSPRINSIKNRDGVLNWTVTPKQIDVSKSSANSSAFEFGSDRSLSAFMSSALLKIAIRLAVEEIQVENATVAFLDKPGDPSPGLYENINLEASVISSGVKAESPGRVTGVMRAQSSESEGAQLLNAEMPFDMEMARNRAGGFSMKGSLGPGSFETKNFDARNFKSAIGLKGQNLAFDDMEIGFQDGIMRGRMRLDMASRKFSIDGEVENLNFDETLASKLQARGQITGHINSRFKLAGYLRGLQESVPTLDGSGSFSSNDLFLSSVNISEQVARALQISQIGDMNTGTSIASIETEFKIERGTIRTDDMRLRGIDGLGDARVSRGEVRVASAPTLDYAADVMLSPETLASVKASSPLFRAAIALLEKNNRLTIPVSIKGDVHNPDIRVDISRLR